MSRSNTLIDECLSKNPVHVPTNVFRAYLNHASITICYSLLLFYKEVRDVSDRFGIAGANHISPNRFISPGLK